MSYKHLSLAEKYYIEIELKKKVLRTQITQTTGYAQDTTYHQINCNNGEKGDKHQQNDYFIHKRHA
ncbi:MAG: hypothetical protein D3903_04955 [Candidatus Electrothrix sp. GM3_4]|nr:hypothetical protein [Candidatus Electrothrix sp. GM3_4]